MFRFDSRVRCHRQHNPTRQPSPATSYSAKQTGKCGQDTGHLNGQVPKDAEASAKSTAQINISHPNREEATSS
jgi:hypothetical protein